MSRSVKRTTIYFEPAIHKALRFKAASTNRSQSDLVNEAVRETLRADQEDLAAFEERASEPTMSYEALLHDLKAPKILSAIAVFVIAFEKQFDITAQENPCSPP